MLENGSRALEVGVLYLSPSRTRHHVQIAPALIGRTPPGISRNRSSSSAQRSRNEPEPLIDSGFTVQMDGFGIRHAPRTGATFPILLIATRYRARVRPINVARFTVLTKVVKMRFLSHRPGRPLSDFVENTGSARAMPLRICASGFSPVGPSDSYSICATATCEFTQQHIPIGVPIFPGRSFPGPIVITSAPIELQTHP